MAGLFLDDDGLIGLWEKIKAVFIRKNAIGDSLTEDDGIIDVAIPNKGVISQSGFDSLDETEKNHGVYVIPGDNGGSFNPYFPEIYSEKETVIGRWIDGRPLYRICGEGTTGTAINSWYIIIEPFPYEMEIKSISMIVKNTLSQYVSVAFESSGGGRITFAYTNEEGMKFLTTDSIYNQSPFFYKIEYTKPTD